MSTQNHISQLYTIIKSCLFIEIILQHKRLPFINLSTRCHYNARTVWEFPRLRFEVTNIHMPIFVRNGVQMKLLSNQKRLFGFP